MGLNYRKWKIYPPILSNVGTILQELYVSGRLKLNDIDEVKVEGPTNDQVLVYDETTTKWENEDITNIIPPQAITVLHDEIRMFGGDVNSIFPGGVGVGDYDGWFLCNGQSTPSGNTLDLQSRFVLGWDSAPGDPIIGSTGGEDRVTLTAAESGVGLHDHPATGLTVTQSGSHTHYSRRSTAIGDGGSDFKVADVGTSDDGVGGRYTLTSTASTSYDGSHTHTVSGSTADSSASASTSHQNMPPYVVVAFIQYKGHQ